MNCHWCRKGVVELSKGQKINLKRHNKVYCSKVCSGKYRGQKSRERAIDPNSPMRSRKAIEKNLQTRKERGIMPIWVKDKSKHGGNGRSLTVSQESLLMRLGRGWVAELPIRTGTGSPFKAYKKERLNKDSVLGKVRVESNKVLERKDFEQFGFSDGGDYVYCLETEDNHTFFANSILVHNCNNIPYPIVDQLITRTRKTIWMDWNPVEDFWFDEKMQGQRDDIDFITLTYLDNEAIDEGTLNEIMAHRNDLNWWKVYALGQKGELVTRIYKDWQLIDEIPHEARLERHWLDFGYTNDPTAIGDMYYYNGGYILDEQLYQKGFSNKQIADFLLNLKKALTIADSAETKRIAEISSYGVQIVGANKKNKGRENTYNAWAIGVVQAEKMSVTKRSINLLKEYRNYLWQTDRDGRIINEPIDMWNHHLDGIKYAMTSLAPVIRNREIYETMPRLIMPYDRPKNPAR